MKKVRILIFGILSLLWMGVIFYLSSQNGNTSGGLSDKIVNKVIDIIYHNFDSLELEKQLSIKDMWSFLVRKCAHMTEFAILGLFIFLFLIDITKPKYNTLITLSFCFLYALSDEFHQKFISDRVMSIKDVFIDFFGSLIMVLLILLIIKIRKVRSLNLKG